MTEQSITHDIEIWKPVVGWDDLFEVSSIGRVRSLITGRIRKSHKDEAGYMRIRLTKDDRGGTYKVHRLVVAAFLGKQDLIVDHINGIRSDNRISNLRYCTIRQNISFNKINKTGFMGVSFDPKRKNYKAACKTKGKETFLGRYKTPEEASDAYIRYIESIKNIDISLAQKTTFSKVYS